MNFSKGRAGSKWQWDGMNLKEKVYLASIRMCSAMAKAKARAKAGNRNRPSPCTPQWHGSQRSQTSGSKSTPSCICKSLQDASIRFDFIAPKLGIHLWGIPNMVHPIPIVCGLKEFSSILTRQLSEIPVTMIGGVWGPRCQMNLDCYSLTWSWLWFAATSSHFCQDQIIWSSPRCLRSTRRNNCCKDTMHKLMHAGPSPAQATKFVNVNSCFFAEASFLKYVWLFWAESPNSKIYVISNNYDLNLICTCVFTTRTGLDSRCSI